MRAIQVSEFGGPEVLELVEMPDPQPTRRPRAGARDLRRHQLRRHPPGRRRLPGPAAAAVRPGAEVVGTSRRRRAGGRAASSGGGYAEQALAHPATTFALPDAVDDTTALALVLQGTTAWHLLRTCAHLAAGETRGGDLRGRRGGQPGRAAGQQMGAGRVIATASSADKCDLARELGADVAVTVRRRRRRGRRALREANDGTPVDIVLEMTGGAVFDGVLAALAPFGRLVDLRHGLAGPPTPIDTGRLMATSRAVIGFWLVHACGCPAGCGPAMEELLSCTPAAGCARVDGGRYPLADARRAHEDLRSRRTHGKLTLDPTR